jgi:hypothetical protein
MRAAALLVVALGACSGPATSSLPAHTTAPRPAPTTPPPEVTFTTMHFDVSRLPAVAADGGLVVHTEIDTDGGRGNPNLALVIRDRSDRELERIVVVTANEAEGQYDEHGPSPVLAAKIAAANTRLADLHRRTDLRPLTRLAGEANPLATDEGNQARGQGLLVELSARRLTIRAGSTSVVDLAIPASWSVPDKKLCTTCEEVCRHPLFLDAVHAGVDHTLVLLTVAYSGNDMCPEPVSQHHVITW